MGVNANNIKTVWRGFLRKLFLVSLLFGAILGAGCSTTPRWDAALSGDALQGISRPIGPIIEDPVSLPRLNIRNIRPSYHLGPQDELTITIWGARDILSEIKTLSEQVPHTTVVQDDGTVVLPLLENVSVVGLTVSRALAKIAGAYKKTLGVPFQVDGGVSKFRSKGVLLDGAFSKPGVSYLGPDLMTLGEVVTNAGGVQEGGDASSGVLVREDKRYAINFQDAQEGKNDQVNIELLAGDRLFFPSRSSKVFYVFGEVGIQGAYPIPPGGATLLQGLGAARGPNTITANMESIFLIRNIEKDPKVYQLNLADILSTQDVALAPGDRIFVPPTGLANWERTFRQILPLVSVVPIVGALVPYIPNP